MSGHVAHVMVQLYAAGHATWLKLSTARDERRSQVDFVSPSKLEARVGAAGLVVEGRPHSALPRLPRRRPYGSGRGPTHVSGLRAAAVTRGGALPQRV